MSEDVKEYLDLALKADPHVSPLDAVMDDEWAYIKLGNPLDDIDNVTFKKWFESHGIETLIVPGLSLTKPTKTFVGNIPDESFPGQQLSVPARGSSIHTSVPFEQ